MRYINWEHVTNRYKDAAGLADASDMQESWIADAEAEIDGRLAGVYTVPFCTNPASCPPLIQGLAADLTYCKMTVGRESTKTLKEDVETRLKAIVDGDMTVQLLDGTISDPKALTWTSHSYPSSFGMDDVTNWDVSSRWQQASADERMT